MIGEDHYADGGVDDKKLPGIGVYAGQNIFGGVPLVGGIRFLEFEDESAVSGHGYVLGECYGFTGDYIACNGV